MPVVDLESTGQLSQGEIKPAAGLASPGVLDNYFNPLNLSVFPYKVVMTVLNSHRCFEMS